jgi:hypothetical protein
VTAFLRACDTTQRERKSDERESKGGGAEGRMGGVWRETEGNGIVVDAVGTLGLKPKA